MIFNHLKSKLFLLSIFFILLIKVVSGQIGASVSISSNKALGINMFYTKNNNSLYLGYTNQFNGQKNTVVSERKKTYGTTPIEDGDFFWLVDLGYSRLIAEKFSIQPELSLGQKNHFTSFKDNRFTDNGYSLINNSEPLLGIGINLGYKIENIVEPYFGFHTIKKLNFGVRIHIQNLY